MRELGKVPYSPPAFRLMRAFAERVMSTSSEVERTQLLREAAILHAFHEEFPGVVMHDG